MKKIIFTLSITLFVFCTVYAQDKWAIALHGGAGSASKNMTKEQIAVDKNGNISLVFNTSLMHRAWAKSDGEQGVGVVKD